MRIALLPVVVLGVSLAACEPAPDSQYPETSAPADAPADAPAGAPAGPAGSTLNTKVEVDDPIHDAVVAAVDAALAEQVGLPVAIQPEIIRSEGDWAFVYGPVRGLDGAAINWSDSLMAEAAAEGMIEGDLGVALLNWSGSGWQVVESSIGATDVPQAGWPAAHAVSPALVGMQGG